MPRILYAEDDETLAFLTKDNLEQHGYEVVHCPDGNTCFEHFSAQDFDLCILDIMMPKRDGFELAADIRQIDVNIPIIFLSAKTLKEDRIKGLKIGADDYLVKPFSIEELVLKIEVFLKRSKKAAPAEKPDYTIGKYTFDSHDYELKSGSEKISLTRREAELLKFFLENRDKVVKREEILKALWGDDDYFMGRSLDVFISRLRKILSGENFAIENLHGIGFKFHEK